MNCYVERIPELTGYTGTLRFVDELAPDVLYVAGGWSRAEDTEIASLLDAARPPDAEVGVVFCRGRFTAGEEQPVGSVQGIPVEAVQPNDDSVSAVVVALEERLRVARPDLTVVRTGNSSSMFSRHLARFAPLVGILHADDADAIAEAYAEGHNWDLIVARSEAAAAALAKATTAFAAKIVTVPRAVVATTGLTVGSHVSRMRGGSAPLVVSAGKFDTVPSKRLAEGALQAILRAMPDCRLHFFVEADEQARFAEIAVRAYGSTRVRVDYGWTDERLLDAIGAADLLLATGEAAASNWFVPAAMGQGCVPVVPGKLAGPLATFPALDATAFRPRRETYTTYLKRLDSNLTPERLDAIAGDMAGVMAVEAGKLRVAADRLRDRLLPLTLERRPVRRLW